MKLNGGYFDGKEICSVCNRKNVSLLNLGEPGNPKWICQECFKRAMETLGTITYKTVLEHNL
jgi:transposase-like protein